MLNFIELYEKIVKYKFLLVPAIVIIYSLSLDLITSFFLNIPIYLYELNYIYIIINTLIILIELALLVFIFELANCISNKIQLGEVYKNPKFENINNKNLFSRFLIESNIIGGLMIFKIIVFVIFRILPLFVPGTLILYFGLKDDFYFLIILLGLIYINPFVIYKQYPSFYKLMNNQFMTKRTETEFIKKIKNINKLFYKSVDYKYLINFFGRLTILLIFIFYFTLFSKVENLNLLNI